MLTTFASQNWGMFVLRGVLALLFGVLAFVVPGPTLAALILVFGIYAIIDGILAIAAGVGMPGGPRWLLALGGVIAVAIGVYTFANPQITAIALVYLIGAFAIVRGAAEIAGAISLRSVIENEWLLALSGVASILFGALLVVSPGSGALAVIWLIGLYALFAGIVYVALGWRLRSFAMATTSEPSQTGGAS